MTFPRIVSVCLLSGLAAIGSALAGTLFSGLDLTIGGTATCFPANSPAAEQPPMAFDDVRTTKGLVFNSQDVTALAPVIWTYDFSGATAHTIVQYSLTSANDARDRDPRDFFFEGSNDGTTWAPVDTVTNQSFNDQPGVGDDTLPAPVTDPTRFETYFFDVDAPASFQQYRLRVVETFGTANDRPQIA